MARNWRADRIRQRKSVSRVGVVMNWSIAIFREYLDGVLQYGRVHGPWTLLVDYNPAKVHEIPCHGVLGTFYTPDSVRGFLDAGIPLVNMATSDLTVPSVHAGNVQAGRVAADHLLERGFQQFAFCGGPRTVSHQRQLGFTQRLAERGYTVTDYMGHQADQIWTPDYPGLLPWLESLNKPVGVMASDEMVGWTVIGTCLDAGISVPEEVAVITAGNDQTLCMAADVPLSSVTFSGARIGYEAAALLDRLLHGGQPPAEPITISPTGVVARQSSDILAIENPDVAAAVRMIREQACDGLSVDLLLRRLPVERRWLERQFQAILGRSPYKEIQRVRTDRAKLLLIESDMDVPTIALRCGYSHAQNFGAVFRQITGYTPAHFRRVFRQQTAKTPVTPTTPQQTP